MKIINNLPVKTEVQEQMGNLYQLQTSVKNNLVDAINWFYVTIMGKIGTSDISNTGDGTVTGAIRALGDVAGTLGTAASGEIANNDTTDESGYVADARIVKVHGDEIDALKEENALLKRTLENAFQWKMVPVSLDMEGVPAWGHRSTVIKEAINARAVGIWDSTGNNWTFIHNTGTGGVHWVYNTNGFGTNDAYLLAMGIGFRFTDGFLDICPMREIRVNYPVYTKCVYLPAVCF